MQHYILLWSIELHIPARNRDRAPSDDEHPEVF